MNVAKSIDIYRSQGISDPSHHPSQTIAPSAATDSIGREVQRLKSGDKVVYVGNNRNLSRDLAGEVLTVKTVKPINCLLETSEISAYKPDGSITTWFDSREVRKL